MSGKARLTWDLMGLDRESGAEHGVESGTYVVDGADNLLARVIDDNAEDMLAAGPTLAEALRPFAEEGADLTDLICHRGLTTPEECTRCRQVLAARAALKTAGVAHAG